MDEGLHKRILKGPKYTVFEKVAVELAAVWWEAGQNTPGLKPSKWKDPISFARANFEKFIPKAVELCIGMLDRQDIPDLAKAEIYEALMERQNDPDINTTMGFGTPDVDIKKVMEMLPKQDAISQPVFTGQRTVLHKPFNPYLKVN